MRCFVGFGPICAFKKRVKLPWRSAAKSNTLPRVFYGFKVFINGTKSRKASHKRKLEVF